MAPPGSHELLRERQIHGWHRAEFSPSAWGCPGTIRVRTLTCKNAGPRAGRQACNAVVEVGQCAAVLGEHDELLVR